MECVTFSILHVYLLTFPKTGGFYTSATDFNISSTLAAGPGSANYTLILRDLDAIAVQLKRLSDAKVPVLFRFLHEAEGGWFWWGAQGPAAAKALFRLGYDRFTNYHKLNNLVWVWNSVSPTSQISTFHTDLRILSGEPRLVPRR